jgi:hypothetical protein
MRGSKGAKLGVESVGEEAGEKGGGEEVTKEGDEGRSRASPVRKRPRTKRYCHPLSRVSLIWKIPNASSPEKACRCQ